METLEPIDRGVLGWLPLARGMFLYLCTISITLLLLSQETVVRVNKSPNTPPIQSMTNPSNVWGKSVTVYGASPQGTCAAGTLTLACYHEKIGSSDRRKGVTA